MAEITVDVGVRLKAMQSSVADLQKVLDGLQPNSSGFKALQKIIADINRDIDRLRIQTSKPFGSQNQFNQTEKTVDKLEESLEKVKITIDRIKFSDLKLDSSQTAQLDNFKQQLKDIKQEFTDFKADLKGQFLDNDFNKAFVEGINPNLLNKSFDEIVKNVENRVNSLGSALAKAKADLEEFQNAAKIGEKVNKASQAANGVVSPDFMGQEMFDKFFQTNSKGVFSFKTGGGLKKGEIQQQFLDYLTSEFQLTQTQIDQLKNQTAGNIRKILAQDDFFNSQKGAAETANKKMSGAESTFTSASKNYENAAAVITRLTPLLSALTNEETSLEDKQKLVNQAIRQFEQDCVNGAKGSKTLQDSTKGLSSGLESFKQQLGQVNAQWLNLQKQQATFNSMKSAIVNFMGFNQVLNITKKAVKEAMDHIKQLDTVMNGIAIVTDMTTADLWNQVDVYSEMAQRYGTSIQGAYEVSKIYYQAGYETNEVLTLMNETLKMSKISGLDYATTTDYMMNAIKGFKMEVADATAVVDVYSALAANTAVSQQELAEAMSKTASSMAGVGSTFEDTSAMIATMVSVTRESANNIGSAMKSIASRYGELTKDPTKLLDSEGEAMSFNKVDTALKSVGITLQTTDHQFRDFTDVIVELADKWDTLDSAQQRYIATQFAGNRQQNRFLALVSNKDLLQENMDVAAASEDTGTLQALKALDSLESKLNQVQVAYQQFYTTIGAEGVWKTVLDGIKNFVDSLNGLPKVFDKIPLGAVAVLGNLIGLVKTALLNGLTTIAQEWNNIMNNTNNNAADMAQNGGDKIGKTWIGALFSAIKEGQPKIEAAMTEAVGSGNQKAQQEAKYTGTKINTEDFLFKDYYSQSFNPNDTEVAADTYLQTLVNMEQAGTKFSQTTLNQLLDIGAALENGTIKTLRKAGQQAIQVIQDTGSAAETNTSKVSSFWQELGKSGSNWQKGLTGLSQSLTTIGMLLDKTSESGRIMSGVMTSLGGVVQTGVAAARVMAQDWSALPQLIMGIFNVINGIGIGWETDAERLERLTKEAENLTNESKKAKAEYNTLQRSVDKLDELEKKRYDSAEAAEEYQTAVDELANQFPQLITGLDEVGNATIETANLEYELEKARKAATEATLKAAQAEREKAESELKIAQDELLNTRNSISNDEGEVVSNFFNPDYSKVGKRTLTDITIPDWFGETSVLKMLNIDPNKQYNQQEILQRLAFSGNFAINQDEYGNFELPDKNYITDVLENMYSVGKEAAELFYKQISSLTDETHKINTEQVEDFSKAIQELEPENDNFNDTVAKLAHDIAEAKLQEIFPDFMNYASNLANGLEKVNQFSEVLASTERVNLSAAINNFGKEQQEFVQNLGEGNGILTQFLYNQANAYQKAKKGDLQSYIDTELKNDYQKFEEAYNNLYPKEQEQFLEMWKNRSQYTAKDFQISLNLKDENPILEGIQEYYQEQIPNYWELLQDKINTDLGGMSSSLSGVRLLTNQVTHGKDIISKDLMSWYSNIIDVISDYTKQGKTTSANTIAYRASTIFGELESITDPANRASIISVMNEYGLTTVSGITSIIENLEGISGTEGIITHLNSLKDALTYNIPLAIQAYTDKIVSDAEDLEKNIKNISNGMSMTEAVAALEKINSTEGVTATLADFTEKNGQFYLKDAKMRERYFQAVIDGETAELIALQGEVDKFADGAKEEQLQLIRASKDKTFKKDEYQDVYDTLSQLGLIEDVIDDETKEIKGFKVVADKWDEFVEGKDSISEAIYLYLTGQLSTAQEIADYISKTLPARAALEAGDYQTYLQKITGLNFNVSDNDLAYIAKNGEYKDLDYKTEIKPLKDKINSVYNNLISDALSKGLDNIRPEDYEGLIDDNFDAGEEGPHRYEDFVRRYADLAGKSIEETNALIIQAIEKDTQKTTGAAAEAVGKIQWLSDKKGFASLGDIQSLADALGISVDAILGEYNKQLDAYEVDVSQIDLSNIDNFRESVYDSINEFLKKVTDGISKGISGKLSGTDLTTLEGQLEAIGVSNVTLDFTRTVDGLKLSQQTAIDLYKELSKIDALQGKLIFDDLVKSLNTDKGGQFENISKTTAEITKIQQQIRENTQEIDFLQKDSETVNAKDIKDLQEKNSKLREQLSLYIQIQQAQSIDPAQYKFMDRDLPNVMQGPINYWNSVGEAYSTLNETAKTGKIDVQDFTNIVNEMSNLAQISGEKLMFFGQEIDGSAENAAALIQKGYNALSNVDGKGVKVDLSKMGIDFAAGADNAKNNFDAGIKSLAQSQVAMLDATIKVLEVVVAMEKLGDIDVDQNGIFSIGDIFGGFDIDEQGNKIQTYTAEFSKYAQDVLKAAETNKDLSDALNTLTINGYSVKEMLDDATDGLKNIDISNEAYFSIMDALVKAVQSGDYDLDNLMDSVRSVLAGTGKTFEIEVGDGAKVAIGYGVSLQTNEEGEYEVGGKKYSDIKEALKATVLNNMGAENIESISLGDGETAIKGELTLGSQIVEVLHTEDGILYHSNITSKDYSSLKDMFHEEFLWALQQGEARGMTEQEYIEQNYSVEVAAEVYATSVAIENEEDFKNRTQEQVNTLAEKLANGTDKEVVEAAKTIGINVEVNDKLTAEQRAQIAELAGITTETKSLNVAIAATGDEGILKILNTETPSLNVKVNLIKGTDDTELFGSVEGGDNSIDVPVLLSGDIVSLTLNNDGTYTLATSAGETITVDSAVKVSEVLSGDAKSGYTLETKDGNLIHISNTTDVIGLSGNAEDGYTLYTVDGKPIHIGNDLKLAEALSGVNGSNYYTILTKDGKPINIRSYASIPSSLKDPDNSGYYTILTKDGTKINIPTGVDIDEVLTPKEGGYTIITKQGEQIKIPARVGAVVGLQKNNDGSYSLKLENGQFITLTVNLPNYNDIKTELENLTAPETKNITITYHNSDGSVIDNGNAANEYFGNEEHEYGYRVTALDNSSGNWIAQNIYSNFREALSSIVPTQEQDQFKIEKIDANGAIVEASDSTVMVKGNTGAESTSGTVSVPSSAVPEVDTTGVSSAVENLSKTAQSAGDQINNVANAAQEIKTDKIEAIQTEQNKIKTDKVSAIQDEQNQIKSDKVEAIKTEASSIDSSHAKAAKDAINSIGGTISLGVNVDVNVKSTGEGSAKGTVGSINVSSGSVSRRGINGASWKQNISYATGSKKLLGELGPELVVSNGHYFIVGQNGPEMVDLNDDAIIFNHLQTASLIKQGKVNTHGIPITNERKAVSFATGNTDSIINTSSDKNSQSSLAALIKNIYESVLKGITKLDEINNSVLTSKSVINNISYLSAGTQRINDANTIKNNASLTIDKPLKIKRNESKKQFASAKGTLMGELGPELVVSNGKYFVVGNNGPEMVNLADDAIVFNHLQTAELLKKGKIGSRGFTVTNERNATSLVTGNAGPAMASASAALSALKQLRSMWQSLLNASLKDLGAMGGGSGGGGGGGGGGQTPKELESVVRQYERWYNYIKEIEESQYNINKLTKEYTLLEKGGANSDKRLENLRARYGELQSEYNLRQDYIKEQKKYREKEIKRANEGLMGAFYNADPKTGRVYLINDDENNANFANYLKNVGAKGKLAKVMRNNGKIKEGQTLTYKSTITQSKADSKAEKEYKKWLKNNKNASQKDKDNKKKEYQEKWNKKVGKTQDKKLKFSREVRTGADFLAELQAKDKAGNNIHNYKEQYAMIEAMGLIDKVPQLLAGVDKTQEGWEQQVVENLYDAADADKEAIESLTNSINEQEEASQDDAIAMQEINEQIRELAKPVTGITDGLEEWYNELQRIEKTERNINKLAKERSLLENDHIANGHEIYQNITEQRKQRESELKEYKEFIVAQKAERENLLTNKINQKAREALGINYNEKTGVATFGKLGNIQKSSVSLDYEDVKKNDFGYEVDTQGNYVDKEGQLRNKENQIIEGRFGKLDTKIVKTNENYSLEGKTIDELIKDITKQNADGSVAMNAQQQYNTLVAAGLEEFMQYDEQGNKLYQDFGALDNKETQAKMVEAGIKRIQSTIDELNESGKTIDENEEKALDIENALLEAENELRQKSIDLENTVKDAIVQEHQDVIDEKKELTDAMKDAADKAISGLKDSLDKEKQTYDADTDNKELEVMQAQLATLRLSNGSQSKIQDLAKQIQDKQKDIYFKERELAIDELEDAANKQIDALNAQTDLMQSVLDHQVKYGLIWEEVQNKMSGVNAEELASYITNNSEGFLATNPQEQKDKITEAIENAQIYNDNRRDTSLKDSIASLAKENSELSNSGVQEALLKIGQDAYNNYDTKTITNDKGEEKTVRTTHQERLEHANKAMSEAAKNTSWTNSKKVEEPKVNPPEGQPANLGQVEPEKPSRKPLPQEDYPLPDFAPAEEAFLNEKTIFKKGTPYYKADQIEKAYSASDATSAFQKEKNVKVLGISSTPIYDYSTSSLDPTTGKITSSGAKKSYMVKVLTEAGHTWLVPLRKKYLKDGEQERDRIKKAGLPKFENGGEIDFTGLAWVDGSKNKPEHIFNAEQIDFLKQGLTNNVNLTSSLVSSLNAALNGLIKNDTYSTINNANESIIIEHAEVNVNVDEISSDYDARRLGQEAMAEMVRIARKSGNRYVSRR